MTPPKLIKDILTGPDGATWAFGRVAAVPTLIAGLALPFFAVARGQAIDLAAAGALIAGVGGATAALVGLTNHTEPKGNDA